MTHVRIVTPITTQGFTDPAIFEGIAFDGWALATWNDQAHL